VAQRPASPRPSVVLWLDEQTRRVDFGGTLRNKIVAGCFDVALEHQASTALLIQHQLIGSSFALIRALVEAFIRGIWIERCATERELVIFQEDKLEKRISTIVQEVETALGNDIRKRNGHLIYNVTTPMADPMQLCGHPDSNKL
jgi:hypothetical protein